MKGEASEKQGALGRRRESGFVPPSGRSRRKARLGALLAAALMLPAWVPLAAGEGMVLKPFGGTQEGEEAEYGVSFARVMEAQATTADGVATFVVQCKGPCSAASGGPRLDFQFHRTGNGHADASFASSSSTAFAVEGSPVPWYNFTYHVQLPRAHDPAFRVHLYEPGGREFVSAWQDLPGVAGATAEFRFAGWRTAHRGDAPPLRSMGAWYVQHGFYSPDPDAWDGRSIPGGAPQTYTWDLARYGRHSFPITSTADLKALALAPKLTSLTREGCLSYTVTVDDTAGQAAEGAALRSGILDAHFDPEADRSLATGPRTFAVEGVCVPNHVPRFSARFLPSVQDPARGTLVIGSVTDQDHARGYDKLVFTLYDRQDRRDPAARILGTYDWDALASSRAISVRLADLLDGSALCLMDLERNAILGGKAVKDLANLAQPVCVSFPKESSPTPPAAPVTRLFLSAGPLEETRIVQSGALLDVHRTIPFDPSDPAAALPAVAAALRGVLAEGVGPGATTVVAITLAGLPSDDGLNVLLSDLAAQGVLVLAPAGLPSSLAAVTPMWEVHGLAAHPEVLTVGGASEDGTSVRSDSAHGPSPLLRHKPDLTVRVADAFAGREAQAAAVRHAADVAAWYALRGVHEPRLVRALVRAQAEPVVGNASVAPASATGAGALDPAAFSSDPAQLNPANLGLANLTQTLPLARGAAVVPLPVTTPNALLDIGVVNRAIAKEGSLALENPNGLLKHTLDTHTGSIAAALAGGSGSAAAPSATVAVNVTFYSLLDLAAHNLTDALSSAEVRERLAELGGLLDEGASDAILAALPTGNPPRAWHFVPEATVEVEPSGYRVSCRAPSMAPLHQPLHAAAAYLAAVGAASAHATLQASLRGIEATGWQDCPMALSSIHAHVAAAVAALDARIAASGDSYLAEARAALLAGQRGMDGAAAKSVGRAAPQSATWVPLATDPNLTSQAPPGPYVGIVRITTQDQCIRLLDGSQGACRDVTEHSMATLTLVDHSSFVLRDRAGRPMPGRPVTLERLAAAVNCAGPTDAPDMGASTTALGRLFHGATSFATTTDAQGIARFPWVPPGIYDLKDGSVGFPIHGAWEPAGPETGESEGFGEVDCHKPVPIHAGLDGAARSLLSATGRMPCAKTAARGLPVLSPLWALDAHAGSRLPGPCGSGMGRTEAGAVAAGLRAALNATFGPEAWQIVFPQVQQARLVDDVQADHVDAFSLLPSPVPGAHPWVFTRNGLRIAAEGTRVASDGSPLLAAPAAFRYSYPLPPNEELAMKWKFTAQMTNAAGVAIFTIRDDLDAVLGALANRNPASAAEAAGHLSDLLGDSAEDPVTSCAPAAHYRIVPLSPMEAEAHVHGLSGPAGKAGVEASLMGTEERVSRLFRFHTRECQRDTAHAAFLFFPLPVTASHEAPPRVEFAVQDQGIWTWGGVGSPARGCPGEWCLLKLPGEAAMAAPVAMDTMDESALWIGNPFDPRIEGRDVFVDLMDHTRVLVGPPGAPGPQSFLLHPNHEDAPPMGIAPGVPATVAEWLAEARRSARLDAAGARLDPEGERRLRHDPWTMPDRNPGPTGDHSTLDWQPERRQTTFGPPTDMRDSSPNRAHASNQGAIPVASGRFAGGYLLGAEGSHARVPLAGTPMESGTIMMWVRPDQDRLWDELFFHGTPGGPLQLMLRLDPTGRVVFQTGTSTQMSVSGGSVPSGQWTHVAATWEPGATRIFVNGNEVASIPRSAGVPGGYTHTLIGNLPGTYPGYVGTHGILDEVREHSVALDAATIRSLMEVPYAAADGSPSPHPTGAPRLVGNEVFAYAFDGPAHASGGHMARRAVLGIGTEFYAGDDPQRTLSVADLLSTQAFPLGQPAQWAAPSWSNRPSYAPLASPAFYTKMLHLPREALAALPGIWQLREVHPREGPHPTPQLPPETPYTTPHLAWVSGMNSRQHAMEFHQGVRPGQAVIGDEPERWLPEGLGRLLRDATDSLENLLPDGLEGLDRLVPSRLVDERRQDPDLVQ